MLASGLAACAGPPETAPPLATLQAEPEPAPQRIDPAPAPSFTQLGLASWYGGRRFHLRPTASGELFDVEALTAAHRSLPLDTVARVTNLANGRSVRVRINDRGPFAERRIIDLSQRAARKLGMTAVGVARVRVEVFENDQNAVLAQD